MNSIDSSASIEFSSILASHSRTHFPIVSLPFCLPCPISTSSSSLTTFHGMLTRNVALKAERFHVGDMFFSFIGTGSQSLGVVHVSFQEGSEASLDLNVCLDPGLMPLVATWENELDKLEFIFWSLGDLRNWWGSSVGNWSLVGTGQDSATLGSRKDIALLRAVALLEGRR